VKVAKRVCVQVPYTYTRCVPRVVCEEVPVTVSCGNVDPCSSNGNGFGGNGGLFNGRIRNGLHNLIHGVGGCVRNVLHGGCGLLGGCGAGAGAGCSEGCDSGCAAPAASSCDSCAG
jgi:hypothetical protein